jgi:SAM-dependent methyltransferase
VPVASRRTGRDERAALLPPALLPLFDERFIASWDRFEEYIGRLAREAFLATELGTAFATPATVEEAMARAALDPALAAVPVRWLVATLAARGVLHGEPDGRWRLVQDASPGDAEELARLQEMQDASCMPAYAIAALAAGQYDAVLRGQISGEQALFGAEGISAWVKYFSNGNPLYAVSNRVGALAAATLEQSRLRILELGGGLGSGAQALLEELLASGRAVDAYTFSEISPLFSKRAQRVLARWATECNVQFVHLDIDQPFAQAGVAPGAHDLVYAVNVLHVAHDLTRTLGEIRSALAPGGALVISECVRAFDDTPLPIELIFNLLPAFRSPKLDPRFRPNGGFLTPEQWTAALQAHGFRDVTIYPDIRALRDDYPSFAIAAITARRD